MKPPIENAKTGTLGLIQQNESGEIEQLGLTEEQSQLLQIFVASLSQDKPLFKLPKEYNLKLVGKPKFEIIQKSIGFEIIQKSIGHHEHLLICKHFSNTDCIIYRYYKNISRRSLGFEIYEGYYHDDGSFTSFNTCNGINDNINENTTEGSYYIMDGLIQDDCGFWDIRVHPADDEEWFEECFDDLYESWAVAKPILINKAKEMKLVICNNRDCNNWCYENNVQHERSRELDNTNCRIHKGYELLNGDCVNFMNNNQTENK